MEKRSRLLNCLFIFLCCSCFTGCHPGEGEVQYSYDSYTFDKNVIAKLDVYDSLARLIIQNFPLFQKHINPDDSYQAYHYMPGSVEDRESMEAPAALKSRIEEYFNTLGKNFIAGFDVFKDSSIKIYIRNTPSEKTAVTIEENLSFYPSGKNIKHREFPVKDSILNKHWQYWTRFNRQGMF